MRPEIAQTGDAFIGLAGFIRTPSDQRIALAIYEILATGHHAYPDTIASRCGVAADAVESALRAWPATFRADDGAVTGLFGLSADEHNHRLDIEGFGTSWTWCTFDPLFIVRVLGVTGLVTSQCPVTGTSIQLTVTPEGVIDHQPSGVVMSMLSPDHASIENIITSLCQYIRLFENQDAATTWIGEQKGTFVVSVDEGFEIGRHMTDALFASVLAALSSGR